MLIIKKIALFAIIFMLSFSVYLSVFNVAHGCTKEDPPSPGTIYISNNILGVSIQDVSQSTGIGTFTIKTDAGHSNPDQHVFYGSSPWSTFTTVRVQDTLKEYVTSSSGKTGSAGYTVENLDNYNPVATKISDTRATVSWTTAENLLVTLLIDIRGTTLADTMVQVTVTIKNNDAVAHQVAVRQLWDIMIDGNDDSWIRLWTDPNTPQSWTNTETTWVSPNFQFWETTNDPNSPIFSIYGSTILPNVDPTPTVPDKLVYAAWSPSYGTAYDYTPSGLSGWDSAVLYYWNAVNVPSDAEISRTAYVTTVVQAQLQSFAWSTDSAGNSKSTFQMADNLYVRGRSFPESTNVMIYLIPDGQNAVPANAVASASATTDSQGNITATLVWTHPLTLGEYDIWVDTNQNGAFDAGDVWNNQALGIRAFLVVPEYWMGAILGLAGCFGAFGVFRISKRKRY
jgi:hypothetical protein